MNLTTKTIKSILCALFALFFCIARAPSTYANENDGIYQGSFTSDSCGSGTLLVTMTDGALNGTFKNSKSGSHSISGSMEHGDHIQFSGGGYMFWGNVGNGAISGSSAEGPAGFCANASFRLTRISTGAEISQTTFSAIQDLNARKEITDKIVNEVFLQDQPTLTPGAMTIGPSAVVTNKYKSLNIPFSYSYNDSLKIDAEIPVLYVGTDFYLGNLSGRFTYYSGSLEDQLVLSSLRVDLPTGDKKIGGGGFNFQAGQSRVIDFESSRMFVSYYYLYTSEVDNFNKGDALNLAFGLDIPFKGASILRIGKIYGILTGQTVTEAKYEDLGMDDDKTLLDMTFGVVFDRWDMRAGLSIPVVTVSDKINNSDRLISMDVGFHWGSL